MPNILMKHTFKHPYFNVSTDYKLLWDMVMNQNLRVPGWLVYDHTLTEKDPIWDLVEIKKSVFDENRYTIGSRGRGYESTKTGFEDFEFTCKFNCLHFIVLD